MYQVLSGRSLMPALDDVPCGIARTGPDARLQSANTMFLEMVGEADAPAGRPISSFLDVGGRMYFETHVRPLLKLQGWVRELALELRDGRPILVSGRITDGGDVAWVFLETPDRHSFEGELLVARQKAEDAEKEAAQRAEELQTTNDNLAATLESLRKSHLHVRKLEGILPICMHCKSVRSDDDTRWLHLDEYLMERKAVTLSHSICPSCEERAGA